MEMAAIMPSRQTPLAIISNPCKQKTCRDSSLKVCRCEKIALSDDLKILHNQSIDKHDKLCDNKKSENNKHHTGRKQVTSSHTPHNQLGVPPPD